MPIYAYRCTNCGHAQDVLQRISDPVLTACPVCGQATYAKQVTAAGFQLKGSGWYVTDFRGDKKPAKSAEGAAAESGDKSATPGDKKADAGAAATDGKKADAASSPAPAPAAAPAASPAVSPAPAPSTPGKSDT